MSNWNYAGSIPTSPWRNAMSVPRELGPRTIDGRLQLVQRPVRELRGLPTRWRSPHRRRTIAPGATSLPVCGKALEIKADLRLREAEHAGLKVRVGNGEETVVGYDARPARST
jgi:fructan beta-fructosidase